MIAPMYFQPLSFEQNNPGLAGMQAMGDIIAKQTQNQYMPQMFQQEVQKQRMANALAQIQLQYAPQMTQADLALKQTMPGYYQSEESKNYADIPLEKAQAGLMGTEADKNRFFLNNPGTMLPGQAGEIGSLMYLAKNNPGLFGLGNQAGAQSSSQSPGFLANKIRTMLDPMYAMQLDAAKKGMETQATTNVDQYNKNLTEASQDASEAQTLNGYLKDFKTAYDSAKNKGPVSGLIPSGGFGAVIPSLMGNQLTPEQMADNAARNMQAAIAKQIGSGRMSVAQLNLAGGLKPNRSMTPEAATSLTDFLSAKNQRTIEKTNFLLAARNIGIDPNTANAQWQKYDTENPVYDFDKKQINNYGQNAWASYLNPGASASVKKQSASSNADLSNVPEAVLHQIIARGRNG